MAARMMGIYRRSEDGVPVYKGKWAVTDSLLERTDNIQAFVLKLRKTSSSAQTADDGPLDGLYDGIFTMKTGTSNDLVRVRENGVHLRFSANGMDRFLVNGEGTNQYGRFKITGALTKGAGNAFLGKTTKVYQPAGGVAPRTSTRESTRVDYAALDGDVETTLAESTNAFVAMLKAREFAKFSFPQLADGTSLTLDYMRRTGFTEPILIDSKRGLGLTVPARGFGVKDVIGTCGAREKVNVMEVMTQQGLAGWTLGKWSKYFETEGSRDQILNVISFEFSETPLAPKVVPPRIVRQLDWVYQHWPERLHSAGDYPKAERYCLMSVAGCYTDFHVDFGGTSVWYHIMKGRKQFFFVSPTPENMRRFEAWSNSPKQTEFFADSVECTKVTITAGQTLLIPTGWIHAVFTPKDSLVFGGNFLHALNIPGQLRVNMLESRLGVADAYRYPHYMRVQWFAAAAMLDSLRYAALVEDSAADSRSGVTSVFGSDSGSGSGARNYSTLRLGAATRAMKTRRRRLGRQGCVALLTLTDRERKGLLPLVRFLKDWLVRANRLRELQKEAGVEGQGGEGSAAIGGARGTHLAQIAESSQLAARRVGCDGPMQMLQELESRAKEKATPWDEIAASAIGHEQDVGSDDERFEYTPSVAVQQEQEGGAGSGGRGGGASTGGGGGGDGGEEQLRLTFSFSAASATSSAVSAPLLVGSRVGGAAGGTATKQSTLKHYLAARVAGFEGMLEGSDAPTSSRSSSSCGLKRPASGSLGGESAGARGSGGSGAPKTKISARASLKKKFMKRR